MGVRRSKSPSFVDLKKIKRNKRFKYIISHNRNLRLLSFGTNVRGANTFLKRKYNSRIWNILHNRFPSVFPTFSTNKRWWRLNAFSSFGRHSCEPRLARLQKGRLRQHENTKKKSILQRLLKMPWNTRLKLYTTRMAKIQGPKEGKTYSLRS